MTTVKEAKFAVAAILYTMDRRVWLAERLDPTRRFVNHWAFPGGGLEPGENPHAGIAREIVEETGLKIDTERFAAINILDHVEYRTYWFSVLLGSNEIPKHMEPKQQGPWKICELLALPSPLMPGHTDMINQWTTKGGI